MFCHVVTVWDSVHLSVWTVCLAVHQLQYIVSGIIYVESYYDRFQADFPNFKVHNNGVGYKQAYPSPLK